MERKEIIKQMRSILEDDGQKGAFIQDTKDPFFKVIDFSELTDDEFIDYFVAFTVVLYAIYKDADIIERFSQYGKTTSEIIAYFRKIANEAKGQSKTLLKDIPIKNHAIANSALLNHAQKDVINGGAYDVTMINARSNAPEVTAYTIISYDEEKSGIKLECDHITEFQRQVSDAVFTLYLAALEQNIPPVITSDMIYKAMPGSGDHASAQQKGAITRTVEFFRFLGVEVDVTAEYRKLELINDDEEMTFDDLYFTYGRLQKKSKNGKNVTAYHFDKMPPVLRHSIDTNKLIKVPKELLHIPKIKNGKITTQPAKMTDDRQAMTGYLLRRVLAIKDDRKKHKKKPRLSNVILFESVFKECGINIEIKGGNAKNRQKKRRYCEFCFDVMRYWQKCGLIKKYGKRVAPGSAQHIDAIIIEI